MDILKFLTLYLLVLFAFGCGMNQLLWYYADLEYEKCYSLPGGLPDLKGEVLHKNIKVVKLRIKHTACNFSKVPVLRGMVLSSLKYDW